MPILGAQKSFLVQHILSSINSDKYFVIVNTQGLHGLKKNLGKIFEKKMLN